MKRIVLLLIACLLFGCTPTKYNESLEKEQIKLGTELLEESLKELDAPFELTNVYMVSGAKEGQGIYSGYYGSHMAEGIFMCEGKRYEAYVNTDTKEVYTNYYLDAYKERLSEALGKDLYVSSIQLSQIVHFENIPEKKDTVNVYVELNNVLPLNFETMTLDEISESVSLVGFDAYYTDEVQSLDVDLTKSLIKQLNHEDFGTYNVYNVPEFEIDYLKEHNKVSQTVHFSMCEDYVFEYADEQVEDVYHYHRIYEENGLGFNAVFKEYTGDRISSIEIDGNEMHYSEMYDLVYIYVKDKAYTKCTITKKDKVSEETLVDLGNGYSSIQVSNKYGLLMDDQDLCFE